MGSQCFLRLRMLLLLIIAASSASFAQELSDPAFLVGTASGKFNFSYSQTPDQLLQIHPPSFISIAFGYQWESSPVAVPSLTTNTSWTVVQAPSTNHNYTIPGPLAQTTYYRCKAQPVGSSNYFYSNTIKITIVSTNWEDINYIREHDVMVPGISDWKTVDQMPIGQKLQSTTYLDGLGRSQQKISRETATPATPNGAWGDMVQFAEYDPYGRQSKKYLPYTTTTESGKLKSAPLTEQVQYYTNTYSETSAFSAITFDNSPLNRVKIVKESGAAWANSAGNKADYEVNTSDDDVQIFSVDYVQGHPPVHNGAYPANTLYKLTYTDVNNNRVIEYTNKSGQLILKKIELVIDHPGAYDGWICTYSIYDDFGLLRYQLQPEAIKYLAGHAWSFADPIDGPKILNEQCFQYNYDEKGHTTWKKAPGAEPLKMLYDARDRVVFMQDGNQAAMSTSQWTTNLYDELDRPVMTALYNTTKTIAALQTDIDNSGSNTSITTTDPGGPLNDLSVPSRNTAISLYAARNSITFEDGFISANGDNFVAEIDPNVSTLASTVSNTVYSNPVAAADLSNPGVTTILKYLFYDDYSFTGAKSFSTNFTNTTAYANSGQYIIPITPTNRTTNMSTGSKTRILGTNVFLNSTSYFDEKGRQIQSSDDNIKSGSDITTLQYHFDGRLLSSCMKHSAAGTGYSGFVTLNKYLFDKLGRVVSLQKQLGSNPFKTVSTFDYDDMGRVKTKHLDPDYNNPNSGQADLESLTYNFNIHNQIIGINKDYALKNPAANYNKWDHFFGMYLGFDDKENVFSNKQLNGQVGGILWNTQGDDAQRKYDYTYDNAGRLVNAVFNEKQHTSDSWANNKIDFSVSGSSGKITYDLNGNLLTMLQKGVVPGTPAPITIDDLHYTYAHLSNKLQSVTDQMTVTNTNGQFGDFKDGSNGSAPDYVYDANGNLVIDLNKNAKDLGNVAGANGIRYNFLDKPEQIRVAGKGTIRIVYDADGEKLQRAFIPESGAASTITTYINEFVYQETAALTVTSSAPFAGNGVSLAYINFEEGRIRAMQPNAQNNGLDALAENGNITLPNGKSGAWDYFIMDYQKNVRMILTEETHSAMNTATMEPARAGAEEPVFGQTGASNELAKSRWQTPDGWKPTNSSDKVSRLGNLAGQNIGPNTLQKVMAGDKITANVQYYYEDAGSGDNPNFATNLLSSLSQAIIGGNAATATVHNYAAGITDQLNGSAGFLNAIKPAGAGAGTTPQAYLTILFFDERFNLIAEEDGGVAQQRVAGSSTANNAPLGLSSIKAPKNGYAFVYVSNNSDQAVYFDNLKVATVAGNIIEENHYYAYGLKITGISSKKLGDANEGKLKNPHQYNDKEMLDEDADLNWLDYGFRNYDPQIGRFGQLDPLTDDYPALSPYLYAYDDPITNVDIEGLSGGSAFGTLAGAQTLAEVIVTPVRAATATASAVSIGIKTIQVGSISLKLLSTVLSVSNITAGQGSTNQVGGGGPCGTCGVPETFGQITLRTTLVNMADMYNATSLFMLDVEVDDENVDAFQLGYQWVMGTGKRERTFNEKSTMGKQMLETKEVKGGIEELMKQMYQSGAGMSQDIVRNAGQEKPTLYVASLFENLVDNPARAFHGSFRGQATITKIEETTLGKNYYINIKLWDNMTAISGTRYPPFWGGYSAGKALIEQADPYGPNGYFRTIKIKYDMNIKIFRFNSLNKNVLKFLTYLHGK